MKASINKHSTSTHFNNSFDTKIILFEEIRRQKILQNIFHYFDPIFSIFNAKMVLCTLFSASFYWHFCRYFNVYCPTVSACCQKCYWPKSLFHVVCFCLSVGGSTPTSLEWRQKTFYSLVAWTAVSWPVPVKATLETLHFPSGERWRMIQHSGWE